MVEQLAIIRGIGFGLRDTNHPTLFFETRQEGTGALQCLQGDDIDKFVHEWGVYDIKTIEGKPCIVEVDNRLMKYKRKADI